MRTFTFQTHALYDII